LATRVKLERETGFPVDPYPIDSTEVFGTPLCLTDWIMYYPCCLGKRFLTTPLQVLVFWSYRLFILPDHCLHAPGQQQPCGDWCRTRSTAPACIYHSASLLQPRRACRCCLRSWCQAKQPS